MRYSMYDIHSSVRRRRYRFYQRWRSMITSELRIAIRAAESRASRALDAAVMYGANGATCNERSFLRIAERAERAALDYRAELATRSDATFSERHGT